MSDGSDDRIARLAHDLRTPLTIVLGFSELVARKAGELPEEQLLDFVGRIDVAAREMRDILDAERDERLAQG